MMAREWAETFEFPLAVHFQDDLPQVANFVVVMTDVATLRESLGEFYREQLRSRYPELRSNDVFGPPLRPRAPGMDAASGARVRSLLRPGRSALSDLRQRGPDDVAHRRAEGARQGACRRARRWRPEVYDWPESIFDTEPDYVPDVQRPLVFQVFGSIEVVDSLVLTEDDYFDFLSAVAENVGLVPPVVRNALADSALLLLGFRLDEWDVRVLLRSLVSQAGGSRLQKYTHVAAQIDLADTVASPDRARRFLERYFGKYQRPAIDIFWGSVDEFAAGLAEVRAGTK